MLQVLRNYCHVFSCTLILIFKRYCSIW